MMFWPIFQPETVKHGVFFNYEVNVAFVPA